MDNETKEIVLKTDKTTVLLLSGNRLRNLIYDLPTLEKDLNLKYKAEPIVGHFADILIKQLEIVDNDSENYMWHSFWLIINSDNIVVGSADFKDLPDSRNEVEIGYGLGEKHCGKGYMTETVKLMCEWALKQGVAHITAETETENFKSQNVLTRCGFKERYRNETVWWVL